jgi:hypothetical protein
LTLERRLRGLSQKRLAEILDCHWLSISELERGVLLPPEGSPLVQKLERFFAPLRLSDLLADVNPAQLSGGTKS